MCADPEEMNERRKAGRSERGMSEPQPQPSREQRGGAERSGRGAPPRPSLGRAAPGLAHSPQRLQRIQHVRLHSRLGPGSRARCACACACARRAFGPPRPSVRPSAGNPAPALKVPGRPSKVASLPSPARLLSGLLARSLSRRPPVSPRPLFGAERQPLKCFSMK